MRYFMNITLTPDYDSGAKAAPQQLMDAMGPYVERSAASGGLISTGGLTPSASGSRLSGHKGRVTKVDGPFAESKEVIGGYAVLEAPSKAAALQLAADFVQLHIDHGLPDVTVEVREIAGGYNY